MKNSARRSRPLGPMIGILLAACVATSVGSTHAQKGEEGYRATPPLVRLMKVPAPIRHQKRRFYGRVAAKQTVDLAFQVNGRIESLPLLEGERVEEGDLIAELDLLDFQLAVKRAELNLTQAMREDRRNAQLLGRQAVSIARSEDSLTARDLAQVALRQARDDLVEATLTAPFEGLVATRIVDNHSTVAAGQPVLRLHDVSEMRIEIDFPERLLRRVRRLENVHFETVFDDSKGPVPLLLREYRTETAAIGQSYRVSLAIPTHHGEDLLPGAVTTVTACWRQPESGLIQLPVTAIQLQADRRATVMLFKGEGNEGTVHRRSVELVSVDGTTMSAQTTLKPDQEIVATGGHLLSDGQPVRRFLGFDLVK